MSSSAAASTDGDAGDGTDELPVTLERTVERLDQGIVVTYELTAAADEPVALDLTQALPSELAVADVGFRTDAAPAEWTVDGNTVHGSGRLPADDAVEYVLGLKLPEAPDHVPAFPEAELAAPDTEASGGEDPDEDATTEAAGPTDVDPGAGGEGASEGATEEATVGETDDGPEIVGNPDGELAESVREVLGKDGPDGEDGTPDGADEEPAATATDGGPGAVDAGTGPDDPPTPRENPSDAGSGLEAAVAAVESELDDEGSALSTSDDTDDADDADDADQPELDLSVPEVDGESADTATGDTTGAGTADGSSTVSATDGGTESGSPSADPPSDEASGTATGAGAAPDLDIGTLAERLAAADRTERRAVQEALGLEGSGTDEQAGTVTVRLENLESRLSAFEAYEDALADFIEDTGTVEAVEETATEAAEAADELRTEVADLRDEVAAARESVEAASEERAALREDVDTLREEVDEALGLRQQLLGALQNAGGAGAASGAGGTGESDGVAADADGLAAETDD